jgi:hypothetical protein
MGKPSYVDVCAFEVLSARIIKSDPEVTLSKFRMAGRSGGGLGSLWVCVIRIHAAICSDLETGSDRISLTAGSVSGIQARKGRRCSRMRYPIITGFPPRAPSGKD